MKGELAALLTAAFWTITALAFESATRKVGTWGVNLIRLILAFIFISIFNGISRGIVFPFDASMHHWLWLSLSGIIGFVLGDLFLFASYPLITSRIAMLVMTLVPPMTMLIGWWLLDENPGWTKVGAMLIVVSGIAVTVWSRNKKNTHQSRLSPKGLLFAFLGTVGQAVGLVLSKFGMQEYDAFAATQIRIISGIVGFVIFISIFRKWSKVKNAFQDHKALKSIGLGSFFGPFLGVSFSLVAVKYTQTGIASTIMALVPVMIILPSALLFKQKVKWIEVFGAALSVLGVALLFL